MEVHFHNDSKILFFVTDRSRHDPTRWTTQYIKARAFKQWYTTCFKLGWMSKCWKIVFPTIIWKIWGMRNEICHQGESYQVHRIKKLLWNACAER